MATVGGGRRGLPAPGPLLAGLGLCLWLAAPLPAETRHLLALRVDFVPDTLETTTGDGTFGSAFSIAEPWTIDPLPHDSLYFDSHLRFLEHWFGRASGGALDLDWEIWPRGADAAYRLPHPMWHYHWNLSEVRTDEQLAELFRHSLEAADADPDLRFLDGDGRPRFHTVVIFHAGVGQDFGEDATPHDIPSAWLGPGSGGTAHETTVSDEGAGTWTVRQGLILPESENHEAFPHGMAGLLALQFGHELGLPNLYESGSGRSVIGKWGLMDQGSANYRGLLPAPLDAWSRLLLGWGEAETVTAARDSILVAAPDGPPELPRVVRIPLTPHEHYLVEYRRRAEAGRDWTWGRDRAGNWARLQDDLEITFQDTLGVAGDSTGALVEAGNLDFDLPGSGLLVWHVDERAATPAAVAGNSVNDDPARRGVDLEEGDGVQDIGRDYGLFSPRGAVSLGGDEDPWQQPSTGWYLANPHYPFSRVSLAWDTEPATATNDGLFTGLRLDRFGGPSGDDYPAAGRFNLSWDLRPAPHEAALAPVLDSLARAGARLQGFVWTRDGDSLAAALSLLDGRGRAYALPLAGDLALWPRGDGRGSLLPPGWQDGLGGLRQLEDDHGEARLLAWRGDSLALFRPMGAPRRFTSDRFWTSGQAIQAVLATGGGAAAGGDTWTGRQPGLFVVAGQVLARLDPATLEVAMVMGNVPPGEVRLVETADGSGWPGLLVTGSFPRVFLAGHNVLGEGGLPVGAELLALDARPEFEALSADTLAATALLRDENGATLYAGHRLVRRIDCPNTSVRPLQFGPDTGLELAFQVPGGGVAVYNQAGTLVADLDLAPGHGAPLTGSRTDAGGPALLAAASGRLSAVDGMGAVPSTWPRVWGGEVDGPVALPALGLVLGLGADGRVAAWEAALSGAVWTQPRGDANGGHRPAANGAALAEPVRAVREHLAFAWPNPAADTAHLRFWLGAPARVTLTAYDTAGDRVARLSADYDGPGERELAWNLAGVAPGAYFCVLEARGGESWTRRVKLAVVR